MQNHHQRSPFFYSSSGKLYSRLDPHQERRTLPAFSVFWASLVLAAFIGGYLMGYNIKADLEYEAGRVAAKLEAMQNNLSIDIDRR